MAAEVYPHAQLVEGEEAVLEPYPYLMREEEEPLRTRVYAALLRYEQHEPGEVDNQAQAEHGEQSALAISPHYEGKGGADKQSGR